MSNMGVRCAEALGHWNCCGRTWETKYVLEEMLKTADFGGAEIGTIIFRDGEATNGDGLLTACG